MSQVADPEPRTDEPLPALTPLQRFLASRAITGLGMFVSKYAPPFLGYLVASLIAGLINWRKPAVYWIVHANLRQVVGPQVGETALHRLVRQVFRNTARNNYELWHLVSQGLEAVRAAVHIPPAAYAHIVQAQQRGKGLIVAGTHTGNFDLGILTLAVYGLDLQVLGLAHRPTGGFTLMDQMRTRAGVYLTSISVPALREAMRRLRGGGAALTGVDRPVGGEQTAFEFFGRPALLPTGHVRLALKTDAAILVGAPYRDADGRTILRVSPPLEMVRTGDPHEDLMVNLRQVAGWMEEYIRACPEQWGMFVPVWPQGESEHG